MVKLSRSGGDMLLERPFVVLTPTVDGAVLEVLARSDDEFTTGRIHGLVGHYSYNGVRKTLVRLAQQGIVNSRRVGNADVFSLNREHLAAGPIVEIAHLRDTFLRRLRDLFNHWDVPAEYAAMFGSAARGNMHGESDIDLLVVRPASVEAESASWAEQTSLLAERVTAWTGNDTRVLEFAAEEVRESHAHDEVLRAAQVEGVWLFGPRTYWKKVSRGEQSR